MNQKLYVTVVRVIRTFVAGFVGYLLMSLANANGAPSLSINQKLWGAAVIAGVTAVLNLTSAKSTT